MLQGATTFTTIGVVNIIAGICSVDSHEGQGYIKKKRAHIISQSLNISVRYEFDLYDSSRSLFQYTFGFDAAGHIDLRGILERDF